MRERCTSGNQGDCHSSMAPVESHLDGSSLTYLDLFDRIVCIWQENIATTIGNGKAKDTINAL